MKVQVVRKDGTLETITLTDPLTINRSVTEDGMNRIITATGMGHWFLGNGVYDGWEMAISSTVEEARAFIEEIERGCEFPADPREGSQ